MRLIIFILITAALSNAAEIKRAHIPSRDSLMTASVIHDDLMDLSAQLHQAISKGDSAQIRYIWAQIGIQKVIIQSTLATIPQDSQSTIAGANIQPDTL